MAAVAGLILLAVLADSGEQPYQRSHGRGIGILIGFALSGLVIGSVQLVQVIRRGTNEYFEVREGGLVWNTAFALRQWPWEQVRGMWYRQAPGTTAPAAYLGLDFSASITVADGRKIRINGLTSDYATLTSNVLAKQPTVVTPLTQRMYWSWLWLWLGLGSAAVFGTMVTYTALNSGYDEVWTEIPGTAITEVERIPHLSDGALTLLVIGAIVSGIAALTFTILFFQAMRGQKPVGRYGGP
ncbi:hypothetical protein NOGI109294_26705 [Nocardiopsis gilva]